MMSSIKNVLLMSQVVFAIVEAIFLSALVLILLLPVLFFPIWVANVLWPILAFLLIVIPLREIIYYVLPDSLKTDYQNCDKTLQDFIYRIFSVALTDLKEICKNLQIVSIFRKNLLICRFFRRMGISDILHYFFLLRVPIISGLILVYLPIIAQWGYPKFLRNLFVMESPAQLMMIIVFTFMTAMIVISLLMSIIILSDTTKPIRYNLRFILTRITWAIVLSSPTFIVLFLNRKEENTYCLVGLAIMIIFSFLLLHIIFEYNLTTKRNEINPCSILQQIQKYFIRKELNIQLFLGFEVLIVAFIYVIVIYFNWPRPDGRIGIETYYQAPTLLYILLVISIITLLLGGIIHVFDKYSDNHFITNSSNSSEYHFHWPIILLLLIFSASAYGTFQVDHYFELKNSKLPSINYREDFKIAIANRLCPEDFKRYKSCQKNQSLVVVAASGGGIQSSGWTAQVLAGLQDKTLGIGEDFTKAIGLISSTSGGSVGTMFYLEKFKKGILNKPQKMIKNATDDWLDSVGWGLAFPDLLKPMGFPWGLNFFGENGKFLDRGYALERDWLRSLIGLNDTMFPKSDPKPDSEDDYLTLDYWYKKAKEGEIPIPVFNATLVENGRRFLISPMKFIPGQMSNYLSSSKLLDNDLQLSDEDKQKIKLSKALDFRTLYNCGTPENAKVCNLDVITAARLSASFPYVSPMARNDRENEIKVPNSKGNEHILQNYHIADGGYFDNSGEFTAVQWLNEFLEDNAEVLKIEKVILLQIDGFLEEPLKRHQIGHKGFFTVLFGPLNALNGVRESTQIDRNIQAVKLLTNSWNNRNIKIKRFSISFPDKDKNGNKYSQPLSWQLTEKQKDNLTDSWEKDPTIRKTVDCMKEFWNNDQIKRQECENMT